MRTNRQSAQVSLAFLIASAISLGMLILTIVLVGQSFRGMEAAKITAAGATARQMAVSVDDRIRAITGPPSTALAVLSHDPLASGNRPGTSTTPIEPCWNNARPQTTVSTPVIGTGTTLPVLPALPS